MIRKQWLLLTLAALVVLPGCAMTKSVNLKQVASASGVKNVTTGDGEFEEYQAVTYSKATEVGIGVGLPFVGKFVELFPAKSAEDLATDMASEAKAGGADAVINADPACETYWGFPFIFVGLYVDKSVGTGIDLK